MPPTPQKIPAAELRERCARVVRLRDDAHPGLHTWHEHMQNAMADVRDASERWYEAGVADVEEKR